MVVLVLVLVLLQSSGVGGRWLIRLLVVLAPLMFIWEEVLNHVQPLGIIEDGVRGRTTVVCGEEVLNHIGSLDVIDGRSLRRTTVVCREEVLDDIGPLDVVEAGSRRRTTEKPGPVWVYAPIRVLRRTSGQFLPALVLSRKEVRSDRDSFDLVKARPLASGKLDQRVITGLQWSGAAME